MWKTASSILSKGQPRMGRIIHEYDHSTYHCPKTTRTHSFIAGAVGTALIAAYVSSRKHSSH